MSYSINQVQDVAISPVVVHAVTGMAPNKPFVNNGKDSIAVYPESGSLDDAIIIEANDWKILPLDWVNVNFRCASDTNVFMSCAFTTIAV